MWQKAYYWAKKLHKWVMWIALVLGSGMMVGGLLLHKEVEGEPIAGDTIMQQVRYLHNKMAVPFALTLGFMMLTGLLMWGIPKIQSRKVENKNEQA